VLLREFATALEPLRKFWALRPSETTSASITVADISVVLLAQYALVVVVDHQYFQHVVRVLGSIEGLEFK
jgi:hypothetical protein